MDSEPNKPIEIKCTPLEQIFLKRSIKACECSPLCVYKPWCKKPADMTCGEYIMSLIKWITGEGKENES